MNVLDENIIEEQRLILQGWHIPVRHIGYGFWESGVQDEEIVPRLLHLPRPTFFTLDRDYYRRDWCHAGYCLVYLAVRDAETAMYVRRVLRHRAFDTAAKRRGIVMRAAPERVTFWRLHGENEQTVEWLA